jgi:ribonuclease VapC
VILDSSAVVALATGEPGSDRIYRAILDSMQPRMSAFSVYEAETVLLRRTGRVAVDRMLAFLAEARVEIAPFDGYDAAIATQAYERFGKGLSPVKLNLGDGPVYALANRLDAPVLSTSDEFARAGLATVQLPRQ